MRLAVWNGRHPGAAVACEVAITRRLPVLSLPRAVSLLSVRRCTPLAAVVFPDGEPAFKECPRDSKLTANRPSHNSLSV